jgi:glucose/arabinose dehydrogenase
MIGGKQMVAPFRRLVPFAAAAVMLLATAIPVAAALPVTLVDDGYSLPLFLGNAGDSRLFVVEKGGLIKIVNGGTFLDVSAKISTDGERGLLALAFHPNYASNGLFYVVYTRASDGDVMISEFKRSVDPDVADPTSERIVLRVEHSSASNHNGATLMFKGSLLYITLGDGGGSPGTRSQDLSLYVGKILRINPLDPDGAGPKTYSIPSTNPYVGRSGLDEIWSLGLRNPWRCSFDDATGKLWCGDVGQGLYEEIDRHTDAKAINFGWPLLEGRHYYNYPNHQQGDLCTSKCRRLPIVEYPHSMTGGNNSNVTGGYVSRRSGAGLYGKYIFGDFGSGRVWAISATAPVGSAMPAALADTDFVISSFGKGADGRLYLVDYGGGAIYLLNDS